jgi:ADP-ribose pyrophosphatase YjhB (NUDIX family)
MFCLRCGAEMSRKLLDARLRWQCSTCSYIHYENPVPGVGGIVVHDGRLLLIRRGVAPHAGEWAFPSGFIEIDEHADAAVLREVHEETGLDTELVDLLSVHSFPEGPPLSGIIVFYVLRPRDVRQMSAGDDAIEARFFDFEEIPELPFRTHTEALQAYARKYNIGYGITD